MWQPSERISVLEVDCSKLVNPIFPVLKAHQVATTGVLWLDRCSSSARVKLVHCAPSAATVCNACGEGLVKGSIWCYII